MYTIREAAKILGIDLSKARVAIQGYGNAGQFAHKLVAEMFGSKVVAVSDSKGGSTTNGLDYDKTLEWKNQEGTVATYQCCEETKISNEALLELDVDILIPAASRTRLALERREVRPRSWLNWQMVPPRLRPTRSCSRRVSTLFPTFSATRAA